MKTQEIKGQAGGSFQRFVEGAVERNIAEYLGLQSNTETDDGSQYIAEVESNMVEAFVESYRAYCVKHHEIMEQLDWGQMN